jgi:very-short-patch-repair endonuclease
MRAVLELPGHHRGSAHADTLAPGDQLGRRPLQMGKDLLLQESGYLVLRFLAQDVGRVLDQVLDTILRALARRPGVAAEPSEARN